MGDVSRPMPDERPSVSFWHTDCDGLRTNVTLVREDDGVEVSITWPAQTSHPSMRYLLGEYPRPICRDFGSGSTPTSRTAKNETTT